MPRASLKIANNLHGYSVHGYHNLGKGVCVYHQGGLDTYCGFYAILNLINFLKFKEDRSSVDFIGANNFSEFIEFIDTFAFDGPFPKRPFGDYGLSKRLLINALTRALEHFEIVRTVRSGRILPATATEAIGLAAIKEGAKDDLGHWVAFIGKDHLNDTGIACGADWKGIVLDSNRGYERWWVGKDGNLKVRRGAEAEGIPVKWMCRFVFVLL